MNSREKSDDKLTHKRALKKAFRLSIMASSDHPLHTVGKDLGSSNIQIPVDDLYLFDINGNVIPNNDIYLGSTVITVK